MAFPPAPGTGLVFKSVLTADTATLDTGANVIPATAGLLTICLVVRTDEAVVGSTIAVRFNGDTGSNYDSQKLTGVSSTASASRVNAASSGALGDATGASSPSGQFASHKFEVPGYALIGSNKTALGLYGAHENTTQDVVGTTEVNWRSTAAINQVTVLVTSGSGQKFTAGSAMYVYVR